MEAIMDLRYRSIFFAFFTLLYGCKTAQHSAPSESNPSTDEQIAPPSLECGKPLLRVMSTQDKNLIQMLPQKAIEQISQENLAKLKKEMSQLTEDEQLLYRTAIEIGFGNTHRSDFTKLHGILRAGGLFSPTAGRVEIKVTPPAEEALYGAYSCVFTAVGPVDGRDQYGNTIFRFRAEPNVAGWATYSSAFSFMRGGRSWECQIQCQCFGEGQGPRGESCKRPNHAEVFDVASLKGAHDRERCADFCDQKVRASMPAFQPKDSDRRAFANIMVAPKDWSEWFGLTLVKLLRAKKDRSKLQAQLLEIAKQSPSEGRRKRWWNIVDSNWLGYLEAKYDMQVSLNDLESIEVPPELYEEAQSWDDVGDATKLIKPRVE